MCHLGAEFVHPRALMGEVHSYGKLVNDLRCLATREGLAVDFVGKSASTYVLQHEKGHTV